MLMMTKRRLAARSVFSAFFLSVALLFPTSASSDIVSLALDSGDGSLIWNTNRSVAGLPDNAAVNHSLFPQPPAPNRHTREGWFVYLEATDPFTLPQLYEFTDFDIVTPGSNSNTVKSTWVFAPGEEITLELTYSITPSGPAGLPLLGWTGKLSRPEHVAQDPNLDVISGRLFNVFDYNIGTDINQDSAQVTQTPSDPSVLIDIEGTGGISGSRGAFGTTKYSVDVLSNILGQIQGPKTLNNITAPGPYDVSGAFEWDWTLCADPLNDPNCPPGGGGSAFGGFGGFGAVPEPSSAALFAISLLAVNYRRRK